ncbi:MAG TPA: AMP-binding protein [Mycobacteriales bacterium]
MYAAAQARETPDKPAIVMGTSGETLTFAQYEAAANRVAHLLRGLGLRRGDHVALLFENTLPYFEIQGGAERCGLYYTCINSHLGADEVAYIVGDCEARVFLTSAAKLDVAAAALEQCPRVEAAFVVGGPASGRFASYEEAVSGLPGEPIADEELGTPMLYSSGTTGRPKGILRPLPETPPAEQLPVLEFVKQVLLLLREDMTYLSPAPAYHSAPQAAVASALRLGATSVVMERFDPEQFLQLVERYRITHTQMVPTMFTRLLKLPPDVRARYDVSSLKVAVHAAAPCPVPVKQAMIDWWGPVLHEYYGATEANGFTVNTSEEWLAHPGTVGRAVLGEVVILDDDGKELPSGEAGTVYFRGATNFSYFNDADKTAGAMDSTGTASTVGDMGYLDEDGWLFLTDRKSFMIISGGVNIYPQEAENLLVTHPSVYDVAVIGVPDEDLGEVPKAIVQPAEDATPGPELERELLAFCRESLSTMKCPRTVDFVDELPRLPTGKLYKRYLRDAYWAGHGTSIV